MSFGQSRWFARQKTDSDKYPGNLSELSSPETAEGSHDRRIEIPEILLRAQPRLRAL